MKPRLNHFAAAPEAMRAMVEFENRVRGGGLEPGLVHLVKTRASQVNGCAYCIHMHTREARAHGETEDRLHLLAAWRESPLYTERERAALAWTEALTLVAETHAPDSDYDALRAQFSEEDQVKLTLLIGAINAWNRIAIGFRAVHPTGAGATGREVAAAAGRA
jgi:AhpD family alkylhydroperoxidase